MFGFQVNVLQKLLSIRRKTDENKQQLRQREITHNIDFKKIVFDETQLLGLGCLGTKVYKGKFGSRSVAVKVINLELLDLELAIKEIRFLEQLDRHENILRYFCAEFGKTQLKIALELCFITLNEEVKRKALKINPITVVKKCIAGVKFLHERNIVHGDLKPTNILLDRGDVVKISDFGISYEIPSGATSVTVETVIMGSRGWMAPEQLSLFGNDVQVTKPKVVNFYSLIQHECLYYFTESSVFDNLEKIK